jgi:hypothetical protein
MSGAAFWQREACAIRCRRRTQSDFDRAAFDYDAAADGMPSLQDA